ncbi:MAG: hypothetical protein ACOYMA_05680 [Bacteroidia bacterium]
MKTLKTSVVIFLGIFFLQLFISCNKCDKTNRVVRNVPFKTFSKTLIPTLNGSIEFVSDSGKSIIFDKVTTEQGFKEHKNCTCIECCCYDYINVESTRLIYNSTKENASFQVTIGAGDSIDIMLFDMFKMSSDPTKYVSLLRYFDYENPEKLITDSINNCKFLANKTLNGKTFNNVYSIQGTSNEDKKYAKEVFYSTKEGIVAYILDDNSIWLKK